MIKFYPWGLYFWAELAFFSPYFVVFTVDLSENGAQPNEMNMFLMKM